MFKWLFGMIQAWIDNNNIRVNKVCGIEDYEDLVKVDAKVSKCIGLGKEGSIIEIIMNINELNEEFRKINEEVRLENIIKEVNSRGFYEYEIDNRIEVSKGAIKALKEPIYVTEEYKILKSRLKAEGLIVGVNKNYKEVGVISKIIIEKDK